MTRVGQAAAKGAAVAWVRNTVDEAIEAWTRLRAAGVDAALFHARFAMGDRLAIEQEVLDRFGRDAPPERRSGSVLVATQVVEQSLDLDFDFMVSDLAPADLLVQRAGRLWRHLDLRPGTSRPCPRPELLLFAPDPAAEVDAKWVTRLSGGTSAVYQDDLLLWRSAKALLAKGELAVPEALRDLIEWVYRPETDDADPQALHRSHAEAGGKQAAERSFADHNLLKVAGGYSRNDQPWQDETSIATRLGEESRILRLARWQDGRLQPWHEHPNPDQAWALSELTVRGNQAQEAAPDPEVPPALLQAARDGWGRYEADRLLVPLHPGEQGGWHGRLLDTRSNLREIRYDRASGLQWWQGA